MCDKNSRISFIFSRRFSYMASTILYIIEQFEGVFELFITINQTVDYMARGFMILMRGLDITRGIGRVLFKVEPVLGPEIARE